MSTWANRKAAVQAEAEILEAAKEEVAIAEQQAALAEKTEEEVLAELELPNPDKMQLGDDFSAFMKSTVPLALRNRALHTLWRSNPVLANVDMLVDYGEDFTGKGDALKVVKTIYQIGKGMLKDEVEEVAPISREAAVEEITPHMSEDLPTPEPIEPILEKSPLPPAYEDMDTAPIALAPRRRMRFDFAKGNTPAATETEI
ncbi:MAG: DUF3306 domain-containing protein [Paracoccaceae bacterium]